jgi:uncharacterized protein
MKSVLALVLAVMGAISPALAEKVSTMSAPTGYVDDYAGVMTASGKANVEAICREVHDKTKAQIFLVTVKSLDGEPVETFSNDLFHKWKIGEKKTDRGILVLLAVDDHKRRIEVGYGLEGILPDAKAGDIGREMIPALKASDYDEAARVAVTDIANAIATDAKVSLDSTAIATSPALSDQAPPPVQAAASSSEIGGLSWVVPFLLFSSCFGVFGLFVWLSIRRGVRFGGGSGFYSSGGDSFGGSSGGDSGGGSDSFSGGDGGDSGGGGASGDW